jgi:hypothetical protein
MKRIAIWILLTLLILTACTPVTKEPAKDDTKPTEPAKLQENTQPPTEPSNHNDPTYPPEQKEAWYSKIKSIRDFDEWNVLITEWNGVFYYITEDGLCKWNPITETEALLVADDVRGLYVYKDHFYYYTKFQIFELVFGEENINIPIWEHPERLTDPYSMGICGLMIHRNWFYIKDSGTTAIRYNPESNHVEAFPNDFSSLVFLADTCYYIDKANRTFSIYKHEEQSAESEIVRGDGINKKYGNSTALRYDELRSIHGQLYYYIRDTGQFYRFDNDGKDIQFRDEAWIIESYIYPNLCYCITDGNYHRIYEEDEFGNAKVILSVPKEELYRADYLEYVLITESAIFYKSGDDAPIQFAWKDMGKAG